MDLSFNKISNIIKHTDVGKHNLFIINKNWNTLFGKILCQVCKPIKIKQNTLYISVTNHAWINELIFSKIKILNKMKKYKIELKDIKFIVGTDFEEISSENKKTKSLSKVEKEFLKDVSYPIKDNKLKKSFKNMLSSYLKNISKL